MKELREFTGLGQIQIINLSKKAKRNNVSEWVKLQLIPYFLSDKYKGNELAVRQVHEFEHSYKSDLYGTGIEYYLVSPDLQDLAYWELIIDYLNYFDEMISEVKVTWKVPYVKKVFTRYCKECSQKNDINQILVQSINYAWYELMNKESVIREMTNLGKYFDYSDNNSYISLRNNKGKCFLILSFTKHGKYITNIVCDRRTTQTYSQVLDKVINTLGLNLKKSDILRDDRF